MNLQEIADILEFDLEDVEMLINMFLTDTKESLKDIDLAIESNDFEKIKNIAHGIKGSASNLMFNEITYLALDIEQLAKTSSPSDYKSMFEKLIIEINYIEDIKVPS